MPLEHSLSKMDHADKTKDIPDEDTLSCPEDPLQWPHSRKTAITINLSLLAALGTMASTILAPTIPSLTPEFPLSRPEPAIPAVSIYLLGVALGFLLLPGLSELH